MSIILNILREKSPRELCFRIVRIAKEQLGLLKKQFPVVPKAIPLLSLSDFREKKQAYFFLSRSDISLRKAPGKELKDNAERILGGEVLFFSKEWINTGRDYDWVTNPSTGFRYDKNKHWSEIETLDPEAGDIKYIWEKSRFSYLYHIIRYDYHYDHNHSEFVFKEILDWIESNPLNCGPNYVCSQEISLRINNWLFALYFYKDSPNLTEDRWDRIIQSIYWQIRHVYSNINFSRIAVRNNHAITETLTLYLFGLLFPEMPDASKWKKNGKRWFEEEIAYQFEPDGTYLQNSMNYQRVVTQLLSWGMSLAHSNGEKFSEIVYDNAYKSLNFLYQCMDRESGHLPNYGSNDGALFFPLSNSDYRDFRPQLDALHVILTGKPLLDTQFEEALWISTRGTDYEPLTQQQGIIAFKDSGYYLIRENDTLTFFRCGKFKKIGVPDELHLDVWHKGKNILLDGGSYRYNAASAEIRYFRGTESHNTVMIDGTDQMLKGPRFMWFYPPRIILIKVSETESDFVIDSTVEMFRHVGNGISINRIIRKKKDSPEWTIQDSATNVPEGKLLRQLWHIMPDIEINLNSTGNRHESTKAFSSYYGIKEPCRQIEFQSYQNNITTSISL